jgi:hypothetical protein
MRQNCPYVDHNRAREILMDALLRGCPRLVTVRANGGKGKTTLMSWFEDQCHANGVPCASMTFREAKTYNAFQILDALTDKLGQAQFPRYRKAMDKFLAGSKASMPIQDVTVENPYIGGIQALAADPALRHFVLARLTDYWFADINGFAKTLGSLSVMPIAILLDTLEDARSEVRAWIAGEVFQGLREADRMLLIVAGREKIHVDSTHWGYDCCELTLPDSLEYSSWFEYASETGALDILSEEVLRQYHQKWGGDPYVMSQLCDLNLSGIHG